MAGKFLEMTHANIHVHDIFLEMTHANIHVHDIFLEMTHANIHVHEIQYCSEITTQGTHPYP